MTKDKKRCAWGSLNSLYQKYHDEEWGVPLKDEKQLFEFLVLEGMQAGLSWITILKKRPAFRKAFSNFNAKKIAQYDNNDIKALLSNTNIIRNQLKINAAIENAKIYMQIKESGTLFSDYIWQFVNGIPIQNKWRTKKQIPDFTTESMKMSKALKAKGFKFVGPTICYAFMQAVGMVNDHLFDCFRYEEIKKMKHKV